LCQLIVILQAWNLKKNRVIHIRFWVNYITATKRLLPQERKQIVTERNILRLYKPAMDVKKNTEILNNLE
jgi:hypothetical protein